MIRNMHLKVATITKPRGLGGEVFLHVITDIPEKRFALGEKLFISGSERAAAPSAVPSAAPAAPGGVEPTAGEFTAAPSSPEGLTQLTVQRFFFLPNGRAVAKFEEINSAGEAESLRGVILEVERDAHSNETGEDSDEWYIYELVGLDVYLDDDTIKAGEVTLDALEYIGKVKSVINGEYQDLLEVVLSAEAKKKYSQNVLIPMVYEMLTEVDIAGGFVLVSLPKGLLCE
jgi:16S rRNA processing protein RimM